MEVCKGLGAAAKDLSLERVEMDHSLQGCGAQIAVVGWVKLWADFKAFAEAGGPLLLTLLLNRVKDLELFAVEDSDGLGVGGEVVDH